MTNTIASIIESRTRHLCVCRGDIEPQFVKTLPLDLRRLTLTEENTVMSESLCW